MGTVAFNTDVAKTVEILKTVNLEVLKNAQSDVDIDDNLATAEASSDAVGFTNVLAETDTFAQVSPDGAFSFSESLAAGSEPDEPEPLPIDVPLNIVYVVDATGSTDEDFIGSFEDFAPEQNGVPGLLPPNAPPGVADEGDVIDAEIAAFKSLTAEIVGDIAVFEAANPLLDVDADISLVKFAGEGLEGGAQTFVSSDGDPFDPQDPADVAELEGALEATGSNRLTNYGPPLEEVANIFAADADAPLDNANNLVYFLSDNDNFEIDNNPEVPDAITAIEALGLDIRREAVVVPNVNSPTAGGPFNGDFELIDSDGDVAILDSTGNQAGGGGLDFLIA